MLAGKDFGVIVECFIDVLAFFGKLSEEEKGHILVRFRKRQQVLEMFLSLCPVFLLQGDERRGKQNFRIVGVVLEYIFELSQRLVVAFGADHQPRQLNLRLTCPRIFIDKT